MGGICSTCDREDLQPGLPSKDEYETKQNSRREKGPRQNTSDTATETETRRSTKPGMNFEESVADMRKINDIKQYYQVGKELGSGSFGSVRMVRHKQAGTQFAMKIIKKSKLKEKVYIDLMRQELEVSSKINHPHIITVTELLEDEKHVFIVMELVPGGDLLARVMEMNAFSERDAAFVIKQTLLALNFMHEQKITHRDMKLENILCLNKDDLKNCKVTDFGFACHFDPNRKMYLTLGSPLYMAPELCQHRSYDERVDVWSMGIITYILMSGQPPFYGDSPEQMKSAIVDKEIEFPKDSFSKISSKAKDFIRKCLVKNFNERPNVKDLLQHEWIQSLDEETVDEDIKLNIGQQLKTFRQTNHFQQAVLDFIVGLKTSSQDLEELNKMFLKLDVDKNGTLDKEELKVGMDELIGTFEMEQTNWDEFFKAIDSDGNGVIDHKEFIVASFDRQKLVNKANLDMAFDIIDENHDGSLSIDEIKKCFKGSDETWQQFMEEADQNKDGEISRQEFYAAMENLMRRTLKEEINKLVEQRE